VLDADSTLYNPIVSLFKEVNGPTTRSGGRAWSSTSTDQFMTHVAIEQFIARTTASSARGHEQFLPVSRSGHDKHRLFVWDKDQSFIPSTPIA
jgi:hypothetical protein